MGFFAPGVLGISAAVFLYLFMYDRPQVYGRWRETLRLRASSPR
jgi:hypothetical protein